MLSFPRETCSTVKKERKKKSIQQKREVEKQKSGFRNNLSQHSLTKLSLSVVLNAGVLTNKNFRRISGASMNPARTLGPAVAANNYKAIWVYFTAPILGALTGAGAYSAVKLPKDDGTPTTRSFRR